MSSVSPAVSFEESWIDPPLLEGALSICAELRSRGHQALLAGGCIRDTLLRRPVSDIDIATSATPAELLALFSRTVPVGAHFGVILVVRNGRPYEVATFRTDSAYSDGRHPDEIRFSSPEEDARRRDFTINGLFYDPASRQITDYVAGRADLQAGLLRAIGDPSQRFAEDRLRMLRAVRLAANLGFTIEPGTFAAIKQHAPSIGQISSERIRDELVKAFTRSGAHRALSLLLETGLLHHVLPEAAALAGVPQPAEFHPEGDVFTHTCRMFELASYPLSETLAWGILLHDIGKPPAFCIDGRIRFNGHDEIGAGMAGRIMSRLRFCRDSITLTVELVRRHLQFIHVRQMRLATLKRFLRQPSFFEHLELHRLDCLGSHGDLSSWEFCREQLRQLPPDTLKPPPLVNGRDLQQLGLPPGPVYRTILSEVESRQLEGTLSSREEAVEFIRQRYQIPPGPA